MEEAMEKQKTHFEALEIRAEPIEISDFIQTEGNHEQQNTHRYQPDSRLLS